MCGVAFVGENFRQAVKFYGDFAKFQQNLTARQEKAFDISSTYYKMLFFYPFTLTREIPYEFKP